jgi:hypothetical protein
MKTKGDERVEILKNVQTILGILFEHKEIVISVIAITLTGFNTIVLKKCTNKLK